MREGEGDLDFNIKWGAGQDEPIREVVQFLIQQFDPADAAAYVTEAAEALNHQLSMLRAELPSDIVVERVVDGHSQLSSVNFRGCNKLTDGAASALAQHCPQLSSVNFESCDKLTDGAASALAQHCPQLSSVNFESCDKLTAAALSALKERGVLVSN